MHGDFEVAAVPPCKQELFSSCFPDEAQQGKCHSRQECSLLRTQKAPLGLLYQEVGTLTLMPHELQRLSPHVPCGPPQTWPYCLAAGTLFLPLCQCTVLKMWSGDPWRFREKTIFIIILRYDLPFSLSFSHKDKVQFSRDYVRICVCVQSLSCVQLSVTPRTEARQAPPLMGFYRQEYWRG